MHLQLFKIDVLQTENVCLRERVKILDRLRPVQKPCSSLPTMGFSSTTLISGWLRKMVSSSVVPDLGNPIKNVGEICVHASRRVSPIGLHISGPGFFTY